MNENVVYEKFILLDKDHNEIGYAFIDSQDLKKGFPEEMTYEYVVVAGGRASTRWETYIQPHTEERDFE